MCWSWGLKEYIKGHLPANWTAGFQTLVSCRLKCLLLTSAGTRHRGTPVKDAGDRGEGPEAICLSSSI